MNTKTNQKTKYGVLIGRFQPFHLGHKAQVDKIIKDGATPIIILGSAQESKTEKNPYSTPERCTMIKACYPDKTIIFTEIEDNPSDTKWFRGIKRIANGFDKGLQNTTFYSYNKEEDRANYTIEGIQYMNQFYSAAFSVNGLKTKELNDLIDTPNIRATQIREDLEGNKEYLPEEVYKFLTED